MNTAKDVDALVEQLKSGGVPLSDAVWETACACVGWPYVFGAEGQLITKDGIQVRKFDCQGFTEWCLSQFGISIKAAGCTSQWNNDKLWLAKGSIDNIPENVLVCLFYRDKDKPEKMAHTGFGYKGQTCECSVGVQYFSKRKAKWKYWAIPKGITEKVPEPDPDYRPTLRKGDTGAYVTLLQTKLIQLGYDLTPYGADGKFGNKTLAAVKQFQRDHGLVQDGICGQRTWETLWNAEPAKLYTVHIPHLPMYQAEALIRQYGGGSYMVLEE